MTKELKPIASHCLIQRIDSPEETTKTGLVLVKKDDNFTEGIVLSIGNKLDSDKDLFDKDLEVNSKVLFDNRLVIYETSDNKVLVPFNSIVALLDKGKFPSTTNMFFTLPSYGELMRDDNKLWKSYQNIKSIRISSQFISPFLDIEPVFRLNHEMVFEALKNIPEVDFKNISSNINDKNDIFTEVSDDVWDARYQFIVDGDGLDFVFIKSDTDVENLCKTLPQLLVPYSDTMQSNLFQKISGYKFSKTKRFSITINQEIRLLGAGINEKKIMNSEAMQQFLKLDSSTEPKKNSLLSALSFDPDKIGRIDLNLSFDRTINKNAYTIFLNIKAPANDDNSLLNIVWHIVDNNPGEIPNRNFGEIFSDFFIGVVIKSFYRRWFSDISVITLRK